MISSRDMMMFTGSSPSRITQDEIDPLLLDSDYWEGVISNFKEVFHGDYYLYLLLSLFFKIIDYHMLKLFDVALFERVLKKGYRTDAILSFHGDMLKWFKEQFSKKNAFDYNLLGYDGRDIVKRIEDPLVGKDDRCFDDWLDMVEGKDEFYFLMSVVTIGNFEFKSKYLGQFKIRFDISAGTIQYIINAVNIEDFEIRYRSSYSTGTEIVGRHIIKQWASYSTSYELMLEIELNNLKNYKYVPLTENNFSTGILKFELNQSPRFFYRKPLSSYPYERIWKERKDFSKGGSISKNLTHFIFAEECELSSFVKLLHHVQSTTTMFKEVTILPKTESPDSEDTSALNCLFTEFNTDLETLTSIDKCLTSFLLQHNNPNGMSVIRSKFNEALQLNCCGLEISVIDYLTNGCECRVYTEGLYSFCTGRSYSTVSLYHCVDCSKCYHISYDHCRYCDVCSQKRGTPACFNCGSGPDEYFEKAKNDEYNIFKRYYYRRPNSKIGIVDAENDIPKWVNISDELSDDPKLLNTISEKTGVSIKKEEEPSFCNYCHQSITILKRCSRCKAVKYCSRDCQKRDWKRHKKDCVV